MVREAVLQMLQATMLPRVVSIGVQVPLDCHKQELRGRGGFTSDNTWPFVNDTDVVRCMRVKTWSPRSSRVRRRKACFGIPQPHAKSALFLSHNSIVVFANSSHQLAVYRRTALWTNMMAEVFRSLDGFTVARYSSEICTGQPHPFLHDCHAAQSRPRSQKTLSH